MISFLEEVVLYTGQFGHYHIGGVQILGAGERL